MPDDEKRYGEGCECPELLAENERLRAIVTDCGANYCGRIELTTHTPGEARANGAFRRGLAAAFAWRRAAAEAARKENRDG